MKIIKRIHALFLLVLSPLVVVIGWAFNPVESDTFGDLVEETFRVWNRDYWK